MCTTLVHLNSVAGRHCWDAAAILLLVGLMERQRGGNRIVAVDCLAVHEQMPCGARSMVWLVTWCLVHLFLSCCSSIGLAFQL